MLFYDLSTYKLSDEKKWLSKRKLNPNVNDFAWGANASFITKNNKQNKSYVKSDKNIKAKKSVLYYKQIYTLDKYSLLEIRLETGRHHQIRTQLSNKGMAIKGDLKYGFPRSNKDGSIHLHSRKIEFQHPVSKKTIKITANPPKNVIWDLCNN